MVLKREIAFFAVVIFAGLAISLVALDIDNGHSMDITVRLLALNGYLSLSVAAIMTPFLKEITLFFKKPFIKVHHYFAAAGLLLITLHPIIVAVQALDPTVLLPNFASLYSFFFYGGSIALIAIYVAFGAVLLRKKAVAYWRPFHALMYVALFFGVVHANLWGADLQNPYLMVVYDGLFAAVLAAFVLKRLQMYRIKARRKKLATPPK
jgi:predicted ferric reductase